VTASPSATIQRIQTALSPGQGETTTGYITRDDLLSAFQETVALADEILIQLGPDEIGTVLYNKAGGNQSLSLLAALSRLGPVLDRMRRVADVNAVASHGKDLPLLEVSTAWPTGTAAATTGQLTTAINQIIEALAHSGLVVDRRGPTPTGYAAPVAGSNQWTYLPTNAAPPTSLGATAAVPGSLLELAAAIGGPTPVAAWPADQYIVAGNDKATWNGAAFVAWTPIVTGFAPPTGVGSLQWTFLPAGITTPTLADLQALPATVVPSRAFRQGEHVVVLTAAGATSTQDAHYIGGTPAAGWAAGKQP
jgi:hypothetical protein